MSDSSQDCDVGSNTSKTVIMKSSQDGRNIEIRTRSGQISCRSERLGTDIQHIANMTYLGLVSTGPYTGRKCQQANERNKYK